LKERLKDRQKQLKLDLAENPYRATLRQVKKDLARIKAILA
jgi:ribosomal protein L29